MDIGNLVNQAKDALKSEQAEEISDKVLDGAEDLASKVTKDKYSEQVSGVRDAIDKQIGTE